MQKTRDADDVLNHDYLETRGKILEIAAVLDRIDRAPIRGHETPDPRVDQIRQALEALLVPGPGPVRDDPTDLLARIRPRLAARS